MTIEATALKVRAYPLAHHANEEKLAQVRALLTPWQQALSGMQTQLERAFWSGAPLNKRMSTKADEIGFETELSARQIKSVYNQTFAALSSWQGIMQNAVRETITGNKLDQETKTILYRVNAAKAWFRKEYELTQSRHVTTGEIVHGKRKGKNWVPAENFVVPPDLLKLSRHMVKHLKQKKVRKPDLNRVNSMSMDGTIAQIEQTGKHSSFDYWVRVSTLNHGSPVRVPLTTNKYFEEAPGELSNFVQVVVRGNSTQFTLHKKSPVAEPRPEEGEWLGLDWGMTHLFATSDGRLFGQGAMPHLRKLDEQATVLSRTLQKQGISRKTNKRYQALQHRMREYIKNEVNRILNKLSREEISGLVVESLDFRGGGMSKRLNRLITRFGRGAVKKKLSALKEDTGLGIAEVNAAYSSQECSGCHYVSEKNRVTRSKFLCRFCGKKTHADINSARSLELRRSWFGMGDAKLSSVRGSVRERLDGAFASYWGCAPPVPRATGTKRTGSQRRSAVRLSRSS